MKLLIILSIEEFANDVRRILAEQDIPAYSEMEVEGRKMENVDPSTVLSNWFAETSSTVFSHLFFAFHDEAAIQRVMDAVDVYNKRNVSNEANPIHAYQLDVDKSIG